MKIISLNAHDSNYRATLNAFVDRLYNLAGERGWGISELADHSGLHYDTVNRLAHRKTQLPRFRTIVVIANALGMKLALVEGVNTRKRRQA